MNNLRSLRLVKPALAAVLILSSQWPCLAQDSGDFDSKIIENSQELSGLDESLLREALHAIRIGVSWLEQSQQENGCWSSPASPAITALAVSSILSSPDAANSGKRPESALKGIEFILSCVQDDGGIYQPAGSMPGAGMPSYNTAICMMALVDDGDPKHEALIDRAREFLIQGQHQGNDVFRGGMGYDLESDRAYADLSNTVFALEALRRTQPLESPPGAGRLLDWDSAIEFVSRCQHLRESNDAEWVSGDSSEKGGFVYNPVESKVSGAESADLDGSSLRSYGSMTYAGLLSFLYARVDRNDPRVRSAADWIERRWTVDENPGMGAQGLYYNYHTMAKALDAYGNEILTLPGGKSVAWRRALVEKLVSLQRIDPKTGLGYWQNDNNRWWENDPNLATCYTLIALEYTVLGNDSSVLALRKTPK
ncbi:MAG: terpene cyclase/mutase family protein [Candidatus Hydrogenedentes bacterium]|jgi:squalene-hopene/tetraprenyl-beta-curcumene cyclase|nr:terpene cyclase/mutase family protein [Candidatus Hydrogenedentota bacterium]